MTGPTMPDDGEGVANLLHRIGQLVRSDEQDGDLYPAQWSALRYLARANRFSRNPMALTRYLGTTRGTTSQTLIALERKGYIRRLPSPLDKRSVTLELTEAGAAKLNADPIAQVADAVEQALGAETGKARELLSRLLAHLIALNDGRLFGQCHTCRHFRRGERAKTGELHTCGLLNVGLSDADSELICVEQER